MTSALELISAIKQRGGRLTVEGDRLVIEPADAGLPFMESLKIHKPEIIAVLKSEPHDYTEDLRAPFVQWVDSSCVSGERFAGNLRPMLVDFCEWLAARNVQPCPFELFAGLARELGCIVGETPTGEILALGLALNSDLDGIPELLGKESR